MADLLIGGKTYTGINKVKIPNTDGRSYSIFTYSDTIVDGINFLDYLDTTGNGCVDLGIKLTYPSGNYKMYYKFGVPDVATTQIPFSSGYTVTRYVDQLVIISSKLRVDRVNDSTYFSPIAQNDIIEYVEENGAINIADLTSTLTRALTANSGMQSITPTNNFVLFGEPKNDAYATFANVRFYEFYYQENGVDVIHLRPAIDSNGDKCLFDSVSKTCIYSTNGAFE